MIANVCLWTQKTRVKRMAVESAIKTFKLFSNEFYFTVVKVTVFIWWSGFRIVSQTEAICLLGIFTLLILFSIEDSKESNSSKVTFIFSLFSLSQGCHCFFFNKQKICSLRMFYFRFQKIKLFVLGIKEY